MGRCENSSFSDLLNLCTICNQSFQPGQFILHQNEAHHHVTLDKTMGTIRKETPERNDDHVGLTDNDDDNHSNDDDEDDSDDVSSISSWGSATTIDDDERMDLEDFPLVISGAGFVSNEKDEELFAKQDEDFIGKIEQVFTIKDSNVMNKEKDTTTTTIQTDRNVMDDSSTDLSSIMTQQQQQQQLNSSFAINSRRNLTEIKSPPPSLSPTSSTFSQPAGLETENDRDKNCNEEENDVDQHQVVNSRSNFSAHDDDNDVQCIEPDVSSTATTPQTLSSSRRISKHNYHRFQARDVNFDVGNSNPKDQQSDKSSIGQNSGGLRSQLKSDNSLSVKSSTMGAIRRKLGSQRKIGMMMKKATKINNIATTATASKSKLKAGKNVGKNWEPGFIYVEATDGTVVTKHPIKPLLKNKYFVAESDPLAIPDGGLDQEEDEEVGSHSPPLLFSNFFPSENSSESPKLDDYSPLKLRQADSRRNSDSNNNNNSMSPLKIISPEIQTPQNEDFDESCDDDGPSKIRNIVRSKFNRKLIENLVRTLERKSSMSKTLFKMNEKKVMPAKRGSSKKKFSMPILAAPNVIPLDEILANKIMNNSHNDSSSSSSSSTLSTHCPQSDGHVGQVKRKVGRPRKSEGTEIFSEEDEKSETFESEQQQYHQQDFSRSGRRIKKSTKFLDYELDA